MGRVGEVSVVDCRTEARSSCAGEAEGMGMNLRTIHRGSEIGRQHHHHRLMKMALSLQLGDDPSEDMLLSRLGSKGRPGTRLSGSPPVHVTILLALEGRELSYLIFFTSSPKLAIMSFQLKDFALFS